MKHAGVYFHRDKNGALLYVGQTMDLDQRMKVHYDGTPWAHEIADVFLIPCENYRQRMLLEMDSIRNLRPIYNKRLTNLPDDSELEKMHFVPAPQKFFDSVMMEFSINSDCDLARFLRVTHSYIKLVRLGLISISWHDIRSVAAPLNVPAYQAAYSLRWCIDNAIAEAEKNYRKLKRDQSKKRNLSLETEK